MTRQLPLVVVLGATACGKSKLAIELAQHFAGEIISADSMQVYRGLDLVTNKVSKEEQQQAKHHMIDFLDPLQRYSVVDFRDKTLGVVGSLLNKNLLPIVVGGTNYYIESLLWKNFIPASQPESLKRPLCEDDTDTAARCPTTTLFDSELQEIEDLPPTCIHTEDDLRDPTSLLAKPIYHSSFKDIASEKLWHILEKLDQDAAHLTALGDRRRIIRSLQIIQRESKTCSGVIKDLNKGDQDTESLGGPLRFDKTCVLWLSCEDDILHKVLDERVDQMLDRGLLSELEKFHQEYNQQRATTGLAPNYTMGIFQAIGFKEFHEYLMLEDEIKSKDEAKELLDKCLKRMKISTRQYARRQIKWIRRRFMREGLRNLPPLYKLPVAFDEDGWRKQVMDPAIAIVESFITEQPLDEQFERLRQAPTEQKPTLKPGKLFCEACQRTVIGSHQIAQHISSPRHAKMVASHKRNVLHSVCASGETPATT